MLLSKTLTVGLINSTAILFFGTTLAASPVSYYMFFNKTNEYSSLSIIDSCPPPEVLPSYMPPHGGYGVSAQQFWSLCKKNPTSCLIGVHMAKDCSGTPVGYILLDVNNGIRSVHQSPSSKYKISYDKRYPSDPTENIQIEYGADVGKISHYDFYNYMPHVFYSFNNNNGACLWVNPPIEEGQFSGISNIGSKTLCGENVPSCTLTFHRSQDCSGSSIGSVELDVVYGVKSAKSADQYEISYQTMTGSYIYQVIRVRGKRLN